MWKRERARFCFHLISIDKNQNVPQVNRQKALQHINSKGRHYSIFTDGSKNNNKVGSAAISTLESRTACLQGQASICTAELWAIKLALETVATTDYVKYTIYSDSKSALDSIRKFEPQNHIAANIMNTIHLLKTQRGKDISFCWVPSHVGIAGNEFADAAAKEASNRIPDDITIPPSDYAQEARKALLDKWQATTTDNKLRKIKDHVREWESSINKTRQTEVIITRLRIGHTNLTHSHLMTSPNGPAPQCDLCGAHQSVAHFIRNCPRTRRIQEKYFQNNELKEILGEGQKFSITKIIAYLKETGLLSKI